MNNLTVEFQVESADRAVGIMTEGFSAWDTKGESWCNLDDIKSSFDATFTWYSNETGDICKRPTNAQVIEKLLVAFVDEYYKRMDMTEFFESFQTK